MDFSRRTFARVASLITAGAALPFYNEAALAQTALRGTPGDGAVLLNANENPLGPCAEALEAVSRSARDGGRYGYDAPMKLATLAAEAEGLPVSHVRSYAGSSDPLLCTVAGFCSQGRSFVTADPGYEAGAATARYLGAPVHNVPLTKSYAHDVQAMAKADANAGVLYVCNPNNPTGTLTPRADIEWLLENKPKGSVVLLDEAYIHFSTAEPCSDLVRSGKDLIILRTFSKLYGMAGLRAGLAFGRPDLLGRIAPLGSRFLPVTGIAAAVASLQAKNIVAERRKINKDVREETFQFLDKHDFKYVRSESNKFMLDARGPADQLRSALSQNRVFVGRTWPSWPNHVRVTVGTREEMKQFREALLKATA
jgi:histidinol-phosphate aminotransferase